MEDQDQVLAIALDWARQGRKLAVATVVATHGSAPRPVGARLIIDDAGHFEGSVSSGCVEAEIIAAAEQVFDGSCLLREFGPGDPGVFAPTLTCGGLIRIFVAPLRQPEFLRARLSHAEAGDDSASWLDLATGLRAPVEALESWDPVSRRLAREAWRLGKETLIDTPRGLFFLEVWRRAPHLAIIGAVHIAQTLAPLARLAGYRVSVVDPRPAFADEARFPGEEILNIAPEQFFAAHPPDGRMAVVALTHEARFDDEALVAALRGGAFYVGALGSRASAERRRQRLRGRGLDEALLERLHGPAGLAVGAATPAEIAIAIAAEMTQARRLSSARGFESAAE